ncbi:MAG: hypothetical protein H7175_10805, partial [Burkholderiales bacterium]|nr:hypothetical protein [Anaerolineae bacterium]
MENEDLGSSLKPRTSNLHIGLLTPDLSHAHGWAHHSLSLLEALNRASVKLTVIAAQNSPDIDGITVHKLLPNVTPADGNLLLNLALAAPRVRALLRDCDVIHTTIEPYAPLAAWVAGKRPLFITGHG